MVSLLQIRELRVGGIMRLRKVGGLGGQLGSKVKVSMGLQKLRRTYKGILYIFRVLSCFIGEVYSISVLRIRLQVEMRLLFIGGVLFKKKVGECEKQV